MCETKNFSQKQGNLGGAYIFFGCEGRVVFKAMGHSPSHHRDLKRPWWALFWPLLFQYSPFSWGAIPPPKSLSQSAKINKKKVSWWGEMKPKWTQWCDTGEPDRQILIIRLDSPWKTVPQMSMSHFQQMHLWLNWKLWTSTKCAKSIMEMQKIYNGEL